MDKLENSADLRAFVQRKQAQQCMQSLSAELLPELDRASLLNLAAVLHYDEVIAGLCADSKRVWHLAMPKSGSTWVTVTLKNLLEERGWKPAFLLPAAGQREQEVVPAELMRQGRLDEDIFACQQHCLRSEYVDEMIERYAYKVLIQVRNIPDCIVSTLDHLNKDTVVGPVFYLHERQWQQFDDETKLNYILDFVAPWYIKFWVGWSRYLSDNPERTMLIRYESVVTDPEQAFSKILDFCGEKAEEGSLASRGENRFTRKNVGVCGRGAGLPDWVFDRLKALASYYPDTDFSVLGL